MFYFILFFFNISVLHSSNIIDICLEDDFFEKAQSYPYPSFFRRRSLSNKSVFDFLRVGCSVPTSRFVKAHSDIMPHKLLDPTYALNVKKPVIISLARPRNHFNIQNMQSQTIRYQPIKIYPSIHHDFSFNLYAGNTASIRKYIAYMLDMEKFISLYKGNFLTHSTEYVLIPSTTSNRDLDIEMSLATPCIRIDFPLSYFCRTIHKLSLFFRFNESIFQKLLIIEFNDKDSDMFYISLLFHSISNVEISRLSALIRDYLKFS